MELANDPQPFFMSENHRTAALQSYGITANELGSEFDDITTLAARICGVSMASISFVEESHVWCKSGIGIASQNLPRGHSFCERVIHQREILVIPDARLDPRFANHPLVQNNSGIVFYAGAPLINHEGHCIGALCVMDPKPCELSPEQIDSLIKLSRMVMAQLERTTNEEEIRAVQQLLSESNKQTDHVIASTLHAIAIIDVHGMVTSWNPEAESVFGWSAEDVLGKSIKEKIVPQRYFKIYERILGRLQRNMALPRFLQKMETSALSRNIGEIPIELRLSTITVREETQLLARVLNLSAFQHVQSTWQKTRGMLTAVGKLQSEYILKNKENHTQIFEELLKLLLGFTDSEYGFVAEVLTDEQGAPYLKTHAITDISWNEETRALFQKHKAAGLEFRNLNTLFGAALVTGQPVIANDPASDPRRGGLPPGHPPMNSFLGVPIWRGEKMIAMVGVSNRPGGYDMELVREIEPLLSTYATIIRGYQVDKEQRAYQQKIELLNSDLEQHAAQLSEALETNTRVKREQLEALQEYSATLERRVTERTAELQNSKRQFQDLFEYAPDALVLTDGQGIIRLSNGVTEEIFGWSRNDLFGRPIEMLLTAESQEEYRQVRNLVINAGQKSTLRGRRKNGVDFSVELSISPVMMDGNQCLVTAMRDVSERTHLEQELVRISSHEQERLAHELHDHLGAYLAGIALRFKTLAESLNQRAIPEAEIATNLVAQVNDAINQVRNFSRLMAPVDLETGGLSAALSQLSREIKSIFHIDCQVHFSTPLPHLTRNQSLHLYRIAQEATRNAIHHGQAQLIILQLSCEEERMILSISHEGIPWNPDFRQTRGMGMRIMRHRALGMGGQLTIEVSEQGATTVTCRIPTTPQQT